MSDTNKQNLVPGSQSEVDEEAGLDHGSLGATLVSVGWLAAVAGVVALMAFQVVIKAFEDKVAWPATTENKNAQPLEKEEEEQEEEEKDLKAEHYQELEDDEESEEEEGDIEEEEDDGRDENEEGAAAAGAYFPEDRVPDAKTNCKVGYYFPDLMVPKPLSLLAKEAAEYYCKKFKEVSEETGVEDGNENEELEEEPQKNLDLAEGSLP